MRALKYSKQREAIKDFLTDNPSHPTADDVYAHMRQQFPNVSLGTVYRNLNLLAECGEIRKLSFTNGPDHFDYVTAPHYHFICKCCGRIYDMPEDVSKVIFEAASEKAPGVIDSHELVFYGVCNECLKKQQTNQ